MIISAKNNKLTNVNPSLPNMANTIKSWFLAISFKIKKRERQGIDYVESTESVINTMGVVQPLTMEELRIKPEGCRSWEWLLIHCLPDVELNVNQYIEYDGKTYKVMASKNFEKYGYRRYTVLEAYKADTL